MMNAFRLFTLIGLSSSAVAQVSFGAPENSGQILSLLKTCDQYTIASGQSAQQYQAGDSADYQDLANKNGQLLQSWQAVGNAAKSSSGFYNEQVAQHIIDYVNRQLYPDTRYADEIYVRKRSVFEQGPRPFIDYINPGLIKLKVAVSDAAAAIQERTRAVQLTPMTLAFLNIDQNYANTQEIQQFGEGTPVYQCGQCSCDGSGQVGGSGGGQGSTPTQQGNGQGATLTQQGSGSPTSSGGQEGTGTSQDSGSPQGSGAGNTSPQQGSGSSGGSGAGNTSPEQGSGSPGGSGSQPGSGQGAQSPQQGGCDEGSEGNGGNGGQQGNGHGITSPQQGSGQGSGQGNGNGNGNGGSPSYSGY